MPLLFIILVLIKLYIHPPRLNMIIIGLFIVISLLIILFIYLDKSKNRRVQGFEKNINKRVSWIFKYSLLYGLPLSLLLTYLLKDKGDIVYSLIFIVIPTVIVFGWIGFIEWKDCYIKYLELKYTLRQNK